jgi:hypothetical protein
MAPPERVVPHGSPAHFGGGLDMAPDALPSYQGKRGSAHSDLDFRGMPLLPRQDRVTTSRGRNQGCFVRSRMAFHTCDNPLGSN